MTSSRSLAEITAIQQERFDKIFEKNRSSYEQKIFTYNIFGLNPHGRLNLFETAIKSS